jgi:hypothetical protein
MLLSPPGGQSARGPLAAAAPQGHVSEDPSTGAHGPRKGPAGGLAHGWGVQIQLHKSTLKGHTSRNVQNVFKQNSNLVLCKLINIGFVLNKDMNC